jgi:hypothetical protein
MLPRIDHRKFAGRSTGAPSTAKTPRNRNIRTRFERETIEFPRRGPCGWRDVKICDTLRDDRFRNCVSVKQGMEDPSNRMQRAPSVKREWFLPRDEIVGPWPGFSAREILSLYHPDDYELFIHEWATEAMPRLYAHVRWNGGPGDKGRDLIGYLSDEISTSLFDIYQCKHYPTPLQPHHVWLELGKLCYYTFEQHHRVPRFYYLVAPQGVGKALHELLENPERLRAELISNWPRVCASNLVNGKRVPLAGALRDYVDRFDFSKIRGLDPDELLRQHRQTRWYAVRFGRGHLVRPTPQLPPDEWAEEEARYIQQLLDAYSDDLNVTLNDVSSLSAHPRFASDLARQRIRFYRAASLHKFEQETYPDDRYFTELVDEIHRGVVDICDEECRSGFVRLGKTLQAARNLHITKYPLRDFLDTDDKAGICHHLANDDRLSWCQTQTAENT